MNESEFNELAKEFITAYRQFLLSAYISKDVSPVVYNSNKSTWDIITFSIESGMILGLAKIFEKDKDIGRSFDNSNLNQIRDNIHNLRNELIAHFDLDTLRNLNNFLAKNRLNGSEGISIFDALRDRFIKFQKNYKFHDTDFDSLFKLTTIETVRDFKEWISVFQKI